MLSIEERVLSLSGHAVLPITRDGAGRAPNFTGTQTALANMVTNSQIGRRPEEGHPGELQPAAGVRTACLEHSCEASLGVVPMAPLFNPG